MNITKTHKIIISAVIVVILLFIYIKLDKRTKETANTPLVNIDTSSTTTNSLPGGVTYTIESLKTEPVVSVPKPIPDLDRKITRSSLAVNVTESDISAASVRVKELQTLLKKDPKSFANWLDLAMYQKSGGDYDGAVISWTYASKLQPKNPVPLGNLGNLYAYYIHDNAKAEVYYRDAIKVAPTQVYLYLQLSSVYQDVFKDINKAREVINEGLKIAPTDESLIATKESLK